MPRVLFYLLGRQSTWMWPPACQLCAGHFCQSLLGVAIDHGMGWVQPGSGERISLSFLEEGPRV